MLVASGMPPDDAPARGNMSRGRVLRGQTNVGRASGRDQRTRRAREDCVAVALRTEEAWGTVTGAGAAGIAAATQFRESVSQRSKMVTEFGLSESQPPNW